MNIRHAVLAIALAATLAAVLWPQPQDDAVAPAVEAVRRTAPGADAGIANARVAAAVAEEPGAPRFTPEMAGDLFPSQTWVPPPPPPPKPPPPPPPEPPPLPFKYLGRWTGADGEVLFLSHGNRVLNIRGGDELPGGWQVAEIAKGKVVFNYKPLDMQRTLGIAQ